MDRPDFPSAHVYLDTLANQHHGQHRCPADSRYWRPDETCTVLSQVGALHETLDAAKQEAHTAVHDPAVVSAVAAAMLSGPLEDLAADQQEAWRALARLGLEEFCHVLDLRRAEA